MSTTHILRVAAGAAVLGQLARTEASAIEGSRGTFTGFIQASSVYEALGFVKLAMELAGCTPLPSLASRVIYFTPVLVSYFVGKRIQNDSIRNALVGAQNVLTPLCQTTAVVSCIALIWFGCPAAGTAGLLVLGLGLAERRQWIGPKGRENLRTYFDPALAVMGLFSASWFTIGFCAAELISSWSSAQGARKVEPAQANQLTLAMLQTLLPKVQRYTRFHAEFYKACASGCRVFHLNHRQDPPELGKLFRWITWALFEDAEKRFVSAKQLATNEQVDDDAINDWIAQAPLKEIREHLGQWLHDVEDKDLRNEAAGILHGYGEINPAYIHCPALPPVDMSVDIGELAQMAAEAQKSPLFIARLRKALNDDEKFTEVHGDPKGKTDRELVDKFVPAFTLCIEEIKNRSVKAGELSAQGYAWLEDHLRILIKAVRQLSPDERLDPLIQCIIRLPYCGPGKKELVEFLVASLTLHQEQTPLRIKFLTILQHDRTRWFQGLIAQFLSSRLSDPRKQHEYNKLVNQYGGQKLGIRSASADDDELAQVPPLLKPLFERGLQPFWHQKFWAEHTSNHVVQTILEHIGPGKPISFLEIKLAWYAWIDRQQIPESEKRKIKREYDRYKLMGTDLVDNDSKYNPALIYALLIDMGIINQ